MSNKLKKLSLKEFVIIDPQEKLSKGIDAKKVLMDDLKPFSKRIRNYSVETFTGGSKFRNGDTIVARITPCLENGKTAYVDILNDNEIGFGSTEFIVLREREGISDKNYLFYFATSQEFREVAIQSMTGSSGRQRVQAKALGNQIFEFPSLNEQKEIAGILSSLDDKIDLLHRQNITLEALAETLFRQWFIEEAEENWKIVKLGNVADVNWGDTSVTKDSYVEKGYTAFSATGPDGYLKYYDFDREGIVVSAIGVNAGLTWLATGKWSCIKNTLRFWSIDKRVNNAYLYLLTKGIDKWPLRGSAQPFISQTDAKAMEIVLPPKYKMNDFNNFSSSMFAKLYSNQNQIYKLKNIRVEILSKLISGEVKVRMKND